MGTLYEVQVINKGESDEVHVLIDPYTGAVNKYSPEGIKYGLLSSEIDIANVEIEQPDNKLIQKNPDSTVMGMDETSIYIRDKLGEILSLTFIKNVAEDKIELLSDKKIQSLITDNKTIKVSCSEDNRVSIGVVDDNLQNEIEIASTFNSKLEIESDIIALRLWISEHIA